MSDLYVYRDVTVLKYESPEMCVTANVRTVRMSDGEEIYIWGVTLAHGAKRAQRFGGPYTSEQKAMRAALACELVTENVPLFNERTAWEREAPTAHHVSRDEEATLIGIGAVLS